MFISLFKHLDDEKINELVASLNKSTQSLLEAEKRTKMPAQVLTDLQNATAKAKGAMESATVLINGIAARVQAAVDKAIAGGASAADLAPVQQLVIDLNTDASALSDAVAANLRF